MRNPALGDEVTDIITGCAGIAVGRADWLTGCTRFAVQPRKLANGKPVDEQWFDENRLTVVRAGAVASRAGLFNEQLGDELKDAITGFVGIAVCQTSWISGVVDVCLQAKKLGEDGKPIEQWFNRQRLITTKAASKAIRKLAERNPGGPQNDPRQATGRSSTSR